MNTKILQKCIDELNKPTPDLSYLKGMLETVVAMTEDTRSWQEKVIEELDKPNIPTVRKPSDIPLTPEEQAVQDALAMTSMKPGGQAVIEKNIVLN